MSHVYVPVKAVRKDAGGMTRFASVAVVVSDGNKAAKWYQEKLGFEVRDKEGHWVTVAPKGSATAIHLCAEYHPLEPGNTGFAFMSKDVSKEEKAFRSKGVKITSPTKKEDWGTYMMFSDPDGNEFWMIQE